MFKHLTHIILDGARMGEALAEAQTRGKNIESLYRGEDLGMLAQVSPHLSPFNLGAPFGQWILKTGWGASWGVLFKSAWPPAELYKHLRKFLTVKTESGRSLYFRFYDPRVLRIFLPTCDAAQIREFFGGAIDYFVVEDEDPVFALRFTHQNGVLHTERIAVKDEIAALPAPIPLPPAPEDPLTPETIAAIREMPPETIAALREAGIVLPEEQSSAAPAQAVSAPEAKPSVTPEPKPEKLPPVQPVSPAPVSAKPSTVVAPLTMPDAPKESAAPPKPKTKWNTFE